MRIRPQSVMWPSDLEPWQFGLGSTLAELQLLAFTKVLAVGAFSGVRADGKRKGR